MTHSPALQAKKQLRDAKLKKLKAILQKSQEHHEQLPVEIPTASGESSSEQPPSLTGLADSNTTSSKPQYLSGSYQHQQYSPSDMDIEKGEQQQLQQDMKEIIASKQHMYTSEGNHSLREEVQSLIHHNPDGDAIEEHSTVLEQVESNPRKFLGALLLFLFLWWWV